MPTQGEGQALGQEQNAQKGGGGESMKKAIIVRKGSENTLKKSPSLRKLFSKAIVRNRAVKAFFNCKDKKTRFPVDVVRQATFLLQYLHSHIEADNPKQKEKENEKIVELGALIREMKLILYGTNTSEPSAEACSQLTQEFFKDDTLRLLIFCLPKLHLEARKDVTQIVANLQRQGISSRLIASEYLERKSRSNGSFDTRVRGSCSCSALWRNVEGVHPPSGCCKSNYVNNFFNYIQLPNFDVAGDAIATFKELMTRHKSVAEFLSNNYSWFFSEFNSKLLKSSNYITRRQAINLLGDMLFERSNSATMVQYVSSKDNLRIQMNLMVESSKCIQFAAFKLFKLFVVNKSKPPEIVRILVANKCKFLLFFETFLADKEDETCQADKASD